MIDRDHCTSSTHPESSPKPQSPRPHSSLALRQAWPQVGCRRGSESMASMAAARRQVGKREETVFGNERRARSPASAASRFCSEMKTSKAIAQEKRPGCGHASVPARACRSPASCPPTQRGLCAGLHRCVSVSPASLRPVSGAGTNNGAGRPWWCVVLLKRHSSIVRLPGRTCKHVRAPISHPTVSEGVLGHASSPTQQPGAHLLTISMSKV